MDSKSAVQISNPKTVEFQVVRTSVLPGLLKTVSCNKQMPLPIKVFEVTDVVLKNPEKGTCKSPQSLCISFKKKNNNNNNYASVDK